MSNSGGSSQQLHASATISRNSIDPAQLSQAGAVQVRHVGQVDDEVPLPSLDQLPRTAPQLLLESRQSSRQLQHDGMVDTSNFDGEIHTTLLLIRHHVARSLPRFFAAKLLR